MANWSLETLGKAVLVLVMLAILFAIIIKNIAPGLPKAIDQSVCLRVKYAAFQVEDRDQDCFLDACDPCLGADNKQDSNKDGIADGCQPARRPLLAPLYWRSGYNDCTAVGGTWLPEKQCKLPAYDTMPYLAWDAEDWRATCPSQLQETLGIPLQV